MTTITDSLRLQHIHLELQRDTLRKALSKEGHDLYVAALCDGASKFKNILERPEVRAFLLDPDQGVNKILLDTGDTLVHSMAEQSAACLRIFLEFCKENIANSRSSEDQIHSILLSHISSDLHSTIYEYLGRIDCVAIAALDQFNYSGENPLLKAVFDMNIESVELLLNPGYPIIYANWIMKRALHRLEERQSLIEEGSYKISGTSLEEIRIRFGIARNPGCENPLLKLSRIIKSAAARYLGKTIVGAPLIEGYFI